MAPMAAERVKPRFLAMASNASISDGVNVTLIRFTVSGGGFIRSGFRSEFLETAGGTPVGRFVVRSIWPPATVNKPRQFGRPIRRGFVGVVAEYGRHSVGQVDVVATPGDHVAMVNTTNPARRCGSARFLDGLNDRRFDLFGGHSFDSVCSGLQLVGRRNTRRPFVVRHAGNHTHRFGRL